MLIDCDTCIARDIACRDCVVSVLLARPPLWSEPGTPEPGTPEPGAATGGDAVALDDDERGALAHLAAAGLVPPLRVVPYATPGSESAPDKVVDGAGARPHSRRRRAGPGFRGIA